MGIWVRGEEGRRTVLRDSAPLDHQDTIEIQALRDVVADAKEGRATPEPARTAEEFPTRLAVEPPEGLIQDHEACPGS